MLVHKRKGSDAIVIILDQGIFRRPLDEDRNGRGSTYLFNRSLIYIDERPLRALKVNYRVLKTMREFHSTVILTGVCVKSAGRRPGYSEAPLGTPLDIVLDLLFQQNFWHN